MNNDANKKRKRLPPLPSFRNPKDQEPKKDDALQKKLDSFFTQISKQSSLNKPYDNYGKEIQQKIDKKNQSSSQAQASQAQPILTPVADKKKLTLASINSKLNTMLTSKKISLNPGLSKSSESSKGSSLNPQKAQKKRSQITTEYDPNFPNNFDLSRNYYIEKQSELQKQSEQEQQRKQKILNKTAIGLNKLSEQEKDQLQMLQHQLQQQALQQKEQIALRMMQKFGYKVGTGLGKQSQGIKTPLTIKKTTETSCVIQQSGINMNQIIRPQISAKNALIANHVSITQVIVFINLIKMSQFTQQVQKQLKYQCGTYGQIKNSIVFLLKRTQSKQQLRTQGKQQLRIFFEFYNKQDPFNLFVKLNNRYYNESLASIRFYPKLEFQAFKLDLPVHGHVET